MTEPANPWRRRARFAGGAVAVAVWVVGVPRLANLWPSRLSYREIPGLAPFRELEMAGAQSTAALALSGVDGPLARNTAQDARIASVRADPCTALFGPTIDARLPIAFFSDFNCPNCRVLETILNAYDAAHPMSIRIVRHELPLLGAASIIASKAVLAADRQGGYHAMHDRLMRTRLVTDLNLIVTIATSVGLDGQRLIADMQTPEIEMALDNARAVASVFGFYGTPSTVIGSTVFLGAIAAVDVDLIIADELKLPRRACAVR